MKGAVVLVVIAACGGNEPPVVACGPGTMLDGTQCVVAPASCGSGTHVQGNTCVPDGVNGASYEIQIAQTMIGADGRTRHRVIVTGTNADGTPATDDVVLTTDRAGGTFRSSLLSLEPLGTTTYFTPCDQSTSGCIGPLVLNLALASNPTMPVAHVDVSLVAPFEVATLAPCSVGGNIMYIDGNIGLWPGIETIEGGYFTANSNDPSDLILGVSPDNWLQGQWTLQFNSGDLQVPLAVDIYENADGSAGNSPKLAVSGWGMRCTLVTAAFQVHEYDVDTIIQPPRVKKATVSFEEQCSGTPNTISGCLHYEAP